MKYALLLSMAGMLIQGQVTLKAAGAEQITTNLGQFVTQLASQANSSAKAGAKSAMTVSIAGNTRQVNPKQMLDLVLRVTDLPGGEGAAGLKQVASAKKSFTEADRPMLTLLFLKDSDPEAFSKVAMPFLGDSASVWVYPPASLIAIVDSDKGARLAADRVAQFNRETVGIPYVFSNTKTQAKAPPKTGPGVELSRTVRACVEGDPSPAGTVVDGWVKNHFETPFGRSCRWDKVDQPAEK